MTSQASRKRLFSFIAYSLALLVSYHTSCAQSAYAFLKKGNTYYNEIEIRDSALYFFELAIESYRVEGKPDTLLEAAYGKGQYLLTERGPKVSVAWLRNLQKAHRSKLPPDHGHWPYLFYQFANAFIESYQLDSATHYLEKSDLIIRQGKAPKKIAARIYNLDAWVASINREYTRGTRSARKAYVAALEAYPDRPAVANSSIYTTAALHHFASNQDSALFYARINEKNNREIYGPQSTQLGSTFNLFGSIYKEKSEVENALRFFKMAEEIYYQEFLRSGQFGNLLTVQGNIGLMYFENFEYELAEEYCAGALNYEEQLYGENNERLVFNLSRLAQIYSAQGDHIKAVEYGERMIAIQQNQSAGSLVSLAQFQSIMGSIYRVADKYPEALAILKQSIQNYSASGEAENNRFVAPIVELGRVYDDLGQQEESRRTYLRALRAYRRINTVLHPGVADVYLQMAETYAESDFQTAEIYLDSVFYQLTGESKLTFSDALAQLALRPVVVSTVELKLRILGRDIASNAENIIDLAAVYDRQLEEYLPFIRSESRLQDLQEINTSIYNYLIGAHLASGDVESAFQSTERLRALTVRLAINGTEHYAFSGVPDSVLQADLALRGEVLEERNRRFAGGNAEDSTFIQQSLSRRETYRQFKLKLKRTYPDYYDERYGLTSPDIGKLQSAISSNQLILSFRFVHDSLVLFLLERDALNVHRYENVPSDSLLSGFHKQISKLEPTQGATRILSEILIAPIAKKIAGKSLVIIPDGMLHYLNFEQLTNLNGEYLLFHNEISYAASADLIYRRNPSRSNERYLTAFAPGFAQTDTASGQTMSQQFPDTSLEAISPLLFSVDLAEKISEHQNVISYTGLEASEAQFYASGTSADILFCATHGLINDAQPMLSRLVLYPDKDSTTSTDGLVHTYEIYGAPVAADLVVLTACNTGVGKLRAGEGMLSLAHAFAYNGCPSIVSTRWSVDEAASMEIMEYFLENLESGCSRSGALRQAKIHFYESSPEELRHPYYWAGITLTGDPGKMSNQFSWKVIGLFAAGLFLLGYFIFRVFKNQ